MMALSSFPPRRGLRSFTLIELMVVMAVIAILSAITLGAMQYAQNAAGRSRAQSEIAAFEAGLERYKIDNGVYPATSPTNMMTLGPGGTNYDIIPTDQAYISNSVILYQALSGKTNFTDVTSNTVYMEFKANQVNTNTFNANYIKDPFSYAYGYVCDPPNVTTTNGGNVLFNVGFFDVWSTSGQAGTGKETNTGIWVSNWGTH